MKKFASRSESLEPLFRLARNSYHAALLAGGVLGLTESGVPSNSDKDSISSVTIAKSILTLIKSEITAAPRLAGQISGSRFEQITRSFLQQTFGVLGHLRPGTWDLNPKARTIARYDQYRHLLEIKEIAEANPQISAILGRDYIIAPDIVIARQLEADEIINSQSFLVDEHVAMRSTLRSLSGHQPPILHASVSCKWTLRSDRAQNARSEALNLIRNRKGRLPHIVVVTGEPLPSRLASLALGTGDIDCVYHFALEELIRAVEEMGDSKSLIADMVKGRRLKDVSDLPLDLAV